MSQKNHESPFDTLNHTFRTTEKRRVLRSHRSKRQDKYNMIEQSHLHKIFDLGSVIGNYKQGI